MNIKSPYTQEELQKLSNKDFDKLFIETLVSIWWLSVNDNELWNGSIIGLDWDELLDEAKQELIDIYLKGVIDG